MRTSLDVAMAKPGPLPPHIRTLADRLGRELDHVDRLLESFLTLAHTQHGPPSDESTVSLGGTRPPRDRAPRRHDLGHGLARRAAPAPRRVGHRQRDAALPPGRERDRQRRWPQPGGRLGPRHHRGPGQPGASGRRERRPGPSTPTRSGSSPGRSGASAPSEPDRTAAPVWAWRSSPRSSRSTAGPSTSKPSPTAGYASRSACPSRSGRQPERQHESARRRRFPHPRRRARRRAARREHGRRCRLRRPAGSNEARPQHLRRGRPRPRPPRGARRHHLPHDHRARQPRHGAHAHRIRHPGATGQRPQPRSRRLPPKALPFPRTRAPHPCSGPPPTRRPSQNLPRGRDRTRPTAPHRHSRRATTRPLSQRVRSTRSPDAAATTLFSAPKTSSPRYGAKRSIRSPTSSRSP